MREIWKSSRLAWLVKEEQVKEATSVSSYHERDQEDAIIANPQPKMAMGDYCRRTYVGYLSGSNR